MKYAIILFVSCLGLSLSAAGQVKVWQGKLTLPVYEERPARRKPAVRRLRRYPIQLPVHAPDPNMTGRRVESRAARRCSSRTNTSSAPCCPISAVTSTAARTRSAGAECSTPTPRLKKQLIGYRGAWAAFGSSSTSPFAQLDVDVACRFRHHRERRRERLGTVGNIDRPYGMQWRVELILRPGSTLLEEKVTLYNRSDARRRLLLVEQRGGRGG